MYPTICKIGPVTLYSYGLMLAIAVILCSFLIAREAKKYHIASDIIYDLVFYTIVFGFIGARLFFVLLNLQEFAGSPLSIVMIQKGGLAWQGSLIVGLCTFIWFIKKKKLRAVSMLDLVAPFVALGQSIGRVGCFLSGCCFGKPVAWGIYFPVHDAHLHPTQLYLSVGYMFIFIFLKTFQNNKPEKGKVFGFYIISAAVLRFVVEFYRADHYTLFLGLSVFQYICLVLIISASIFLKRLKSKPV